MAFLKKYVVVLVVLVVLMVVNGGIYATMVGWIGRIAAVAVIGLVIAMIWEERAEA